MQEMTLMKQTQVKCKNALSRTRLAVIATIFYSICIFFENVITFLSILTDDRDYLSIGPRL
jgi:hypothetical protein